VPSTGVRVDKRVSRSSIDEQPAAWADLDQTIMTDYYPAIRTDCRGGAFAHGSRSGGMTHDNPHGMPTCKDIYAIP
jgi:peptide/nickel transport system substrate-binding protein